MKHWKKLASVVLALVMAAALMAPAFAAESAPAAPADPAPAGTTPADPPLTVNKHDYYVLPIFTGTPVNAESSEAFAEGSLKWAGPFTDDNMKKAFINALIGICDGKTGDGGYVANPTVKDELQKMIGSSTYEPNAVAKQLMALGSAVDSDPINAAIAEAIYNTVHQNALAAYEQKAGTTKNYPAGYYLLHDLSNDAGQKDRLLRHVKTESVNPKTTGNNTLNKEVESSSVNGSWNHTGAYEPGDQIPFRIEAPIPDNFSNANLTTYVMTFTDKQDKGLELPDSVTVNVYRPIKEGAATASAAYTDSKGNKYEAIAGFEDPLAAETDYSFTTKADNSFTVIFSDMKGAAAKTKDLRPGDLIVITYTATLKADANGYSYKNHVTLNSTDCEEQKDEDTVYNFKFEVIKVDGENKDAELPGAQFSLYRKPNGKDDKKDFVKVLKEPGAGGSLYMSTSQYEDSADPKPEVYDDDWVFVGTLGEDGETAKFGFDHLIDGSYMLVEDKAPVVNGKIYNKIPPKYYVIKANYTSNNTMGQKLESVDLFETEDSTFNTAGKTPISIENGVTFTVGATVKNFSGVLLPETGGIGTTIFYIVGGVLVVGAVVLLITKRRASADDE